MAKIAFLVITLIITAFLVITFYVVLSASKN